MVNIRLECGGEPQDKGLMPASRAPDSRFLAFFPGFRPRKLESHVLTPCLTVRLQDTDFKHFSENRAKH